MIAAMRPDNEAQRLAELQSYEILDTHTELAFDAITKIAAAICDVPIALISLIDENRQWFKSSVGLDCKETPREVAFCAHAIHFDDIFEVPNALDDERFFDNPLVAGAPNIRFYAGAPLLTPAEFALGTLCVIDRNPRVLTNKQRGLLTTLSKLVMHLLDGRRAAVDIANGLSQQNSLLVMGEQIAHVGHWHIETATRKVHWSDEVFRIHGIPPGAKQPNLDCAIDFYHPDDRAAIRGFVERAWETGEGFSCELRIVLADGSIREVASRGEAQRGIDGNVDIIFGVFQDITERKRAQNAQSLLNERLLLATAAGRVGIWEWLIEENIFNGDAGMRALYGLEAAPAELTMADWVGAVHVGDIDRVNTEIGLCVSDGIPYDTEYRVIWPTGEVRHLRARGSVVRSADGIPLRMIGTNWDVTEIRTLNEQLAAEKDRAERASEAKSSFLATMSHEIRTPMNGIMGMNALLLGTDLTPHQRKLAETVRQSADSLLTIIDDILDVAKLEAGKIDLEEVEFELPALIEKTIELMTPRAQQKGIVLVAKTSGPGRWAFRGDPTRLRQILLNLLSNAIKFTERGSVTIEAGGTVAAAGQVRLRIEIQDTGIGISEDAKQNLFKPFEQADSSITRRFGGTGLGLSICKKLIELMGGRIGIRDRPGGGTIFWFELQLQTIFTSKAHPDQNQRSASLRPDAHAFGRILLAEDNAVNIELATLILRAAGHTVDVAVNGVEAVAAARLRDYDLILMDMQMPELDGLSATREIRAHEHETRKRVPIIAMTANAMKDDQRRCLDAGMDDYVSKPIKPERLREITTLWISRSATTADTDGAPDLIAIRALPVIDEAALESLRSFLPESRFASLLRLYLEQTAAQSSELNRLASINAFDAIGREAHKIVSSAGNFGARQVQALATELQNVCRAADAASTLALVSELVRAAAIASATLSRMFPSRRELLADETGRDARKIA